MKIVLFNMSDFSQWDRGIVNRNFFVLQELLKSPDVEEVLSVDFPPLRLPRPFGWRRMMKYYFENILNPHGSVIKLEIHSVLVQQTPKLKVFSSVLPFFSRRRFWHKIARLTKDFAGDGAIVWNYNPFLATAFEHLSAKLKVFDMVDNWSEHASYQDLAPHLKATYHTISKEADVIFVVARELLDFYQKMDRKGETDWIPNGVDLASFSAPIVLPPGLKDLKRPIIGYVGTIQERIDFDLLKFIAENNPDKTLLLVGPVWPSVHREFENKVGHLKNVVSVGRQTYAESINYMRLFDVAIIPHKIGAFIQSTNPMKMYDYLACGKPVVSTHGAGVDMFPEFILVAENVGDFDLKLKLALSTDSSAQQAARRHAVSVHGWDSRVRQMLAIIKKKLA